MYYEFKRFKKGTQNGSRTEPVEPFSGWVLTWNGKIRESSRALQSLIGEPIENLVEWARANKIEWHVWEVKP